MLGIVALIGLANRFGDPNPVQSLEYIHDKEIILKSSGVAHYFPVLGIGVELPEGWSYLSRRDDVTAVDLIFVNESQHTIVKIQPFRFTQWPPFETETEVRQYENVLIEWLPFRQMQIGRLQSENVDVVLMVMAHVRDSQLTESVGTFCDSISEQNEP